MLIEGVKNQKILISQQWNTVNMLTSHLELRLKQIMSHKSQTQATRWMFNYAGNAWNYFTILHNYVLQQFKARF